MFNISESANKNYLAKVVSLPEPRKHTNADRLQIFTIDFQNVITDLSYKAGDIVVYFPVESAINKELISYINGFEDKAMNANPEERGFFNKHARVRAISLRGEKSQGFVLKIDDFFNWYETVDISDRKVEIGTEFDRINSTVICKKYIPRNSRLPGSGRGGLKLKTPKESRLVDGQFKLHNDTDNLRKNAHRISPDDYIGIHYKKHGTSWVVGNVLTKRPLKWYEKLLLKLGVKIKTEEYDYIYSSRKVIKNSTLVNTKDFVKNFNSFTMAYRKQVVKSFNPNITEEYYREIFPLEETDPRIYTVEYIDKYLPGFKDYISERTSDFYGYDLWADIKEAIKDKIPPGYTLYGEYVGFDRNGGYIQKDYDYGCKINEGKIYVYRITITNVDGLTLELDDIQIKEFCDRAGLNYSDTFIYYGKAKDLYPELDTTSHWHENFIKNLERDYNDKDCYMCVNKVPEEGIVVRKQNPFEYEAFKLKSFKFLEKETKDLDSGVMDIETEQSEAEEELTEV
jgi:hypothetical protein